MVDLLKAVKRKSLYSEVIYYTLNIGLAVAIFALSQTIQSPGLAIALVLLSKWRVLAVRLRFWWTNIQANMVDIIVGVSIVTLMYLPQLSIIPQVLLAAVYALWLVILKPLSGKRPMMIQSLIAIFFGVTALYAVSYEWPVVVVVAGMVVIGYSAARHFLYSCEESQMVFLSAAWGVVFAEIGWLGYYWNYSYTVPGTASLHLPQITIILILVSFVGERVYRSSVRNKRIVLGEIMLPLAFSGLLVAVILLFFNSVVI